MTKEDWIDAAIARYLARGINAEDAKDYAEALYKDCSSKPGWIIPEQCVDADLDNP